jgi:hypothetical protein
MPGLMPRLMEGTLPLRDFDIVKEIVYNRSDEIRQRIYDFG